MAAARTSVLVVVCALVFACAPARASVSPAALIDGPSADILDLGGVAMADDGTGGIVYRKRVDGRAHIFAAQFTGTGWRPAQRVDLGQQFDSSWPAIGAGEGGRLVVVWVQEFGPSSDRLYSAALDPGASKFQAPTPVDLNVGESIATYPSVAMNAGGVAYLTYLVVQDGGTALPPGYVYSELRGARYDGTYWSTFGFPLNRNPAAPWHAPNPATAPKIGIGKDGNGVLVWQEPDDDLIDRVWARRLFGASPGLVLPVSPAKIGDQPLRGNTDAFAMNTTGYGETAVVWRQQPGEGGPLTHTREMIATIPETFLDPSNVFSAPRNLDADADTGAKTPPSVGVASDGTFIAAFGSDVKSYAVDGNDTSVAAPVQIDSNSSLVAGNPLTSQGASGAAALAWTERVGNRGTLNLTERRSDGVPQSRAIAAPKGGTISTTAISGSGLGDAIVGFVQGSGTGTQIAAGTIDAPPDPFRVSTPTGFVKGPVNLRWDVATSAPPNVTYSVTDDDQELASGLTGTTYTIPAAKLDDGVSVVQIIATDVSGQETTSFPADLKVDRTGPSVSFHTLGRRTAVSVTDGRPGRAAGTKTATIAWGDGKRSTGRTVVRHAYTRPGRYRVTVRATDKLGNTAETRKMVTVR